MNSKTVLATGAAAAACALTLVPPAFGGATKVKVRVEGRSQTLLPQVVVTSHKGRVKKDGHSCSRSSGAGALDAATHGAWSATWFSGLGFEVVRILGETDKYTTTKSYWELFVNNVAASVGMCALKLHRGEQLLFAAVPASGTEYPLGVRVLSKPVAGRSFRVKVVYYDARGKAKPLAGATVTGGGISAEPIPHNRITAKTNSHGVAKLTEPHAGLLDIGARKRGYIRAASVIRDVA